jgi:hypothetical protein
LAAQSLSPKLRPSQSDWRFDVMTREFDTLAAYAGIWAEQMTYAESLLVIDSHPISAGIVSPRICVNIEGGRTPPPP